MERNFEGVEKNASSQSMQISLYTILNLTSLFLKPDFPFFSLPKNTVKVNYELASEVFANQMLS
jgi:hypothetical protein